MIIRQYRLLIKAKSLGSKAKNYFALMQVLKVPKFIAQKTYQQSALYKLDQLKKIYKYLLYLDEKFKSNAPYVPYSSKLEISKYCSPV